MSTFDLLSFDTLDLLMSDVMYSIMESHYFWELDWTTPVRELNTFGHHAGCSFASKLCNESFAGRRLPAGATWAATNRSVAQRTINVSASAAAAFAGLTASIENITAFDQWARVSTLSNESSLQETPFCFLDDDTTLATGMCHPLRRDVATCNAGNFTVSLPKNFQYFPSIPTMGGFYARLLYCPIPDKLPTGCDAVIAKLYGAGATSPYSDFYCLDKVELRSFLVQWPGGSAIQKVWKRVGAGCFRITGCNAITRAYDVRVPNATNGTTAAIRWPVVTQCSGNKTALPLGIFAHNGTSYHCPPFESVCTSFYQKNPLLLPRVASPPLSDTLAATLPSMAPQRFAFLDISVTPVPNAAALSTPWWQAASIVDQSRAIVNFSNVSGWAYDSAADVGATVVSVPMSVRFALTTSSAAPLGGLLVVTTLCNTTLRCGPANTSNASTLGGTSSFRNMDCWNRSTAHCGLTNEWPQRGACDAASPSTFQWVFLVDSPLVAGSMYTTGVARCYMTVEGTPDGAYPPLGDPGDYLDVSFYALQPAAVAFNATTGLHDAQLNYSGLTDVLLGNLTSWLSPVAQPFCGNPLDAPNTTSQFASNESLSLQLVATAAHVNALSDDLSPLFAELLWSATSTSAQPAMTPSAEPTSEGFGGVLQELWNASSGAWSRADTSLDVSLQLSDRGTVTPGMAVLLEQLPYSPNVSVVAVSLSPLMTSLQTTSGPSLFGLSYIGPVAPWWSVAPVASSVTLMEQLLGGQLCNSTAGVSPPWRNASAIERDLFATAAPSDVLVKVELTFAGCEKASKENWTTSALAAFTDNYVSANDACSGAGKQILQQIGISLTSSTFDLFPTIVVRLDTETVRSATSSGCSRVSLRIESVQAALIGGVETSTQRLAPHLLTMQRRFLNGSFAPTLSALTPTISLVPTYTERSSSYLLQLVYTIASCPQCPVSLYFEFVIPYLSPPVTAEWSGGVKPGDTFTLRLDDTQYRRDQMVRHPWWNTTNTVLLGCTGLGLEAARWMGQRVHVRVVALDPTASSMVQGCIPRSGRLGVITGGYVGVNGIPTAASAVAAFHVRVRNNSVIYRTSVSDAPVNTACDRCNQRGLCVTSGTSTSCSCFVGYGGANCTVCASHAMASDPNGRCAFFCDNATDAAPVPPDIPPRYKRWVLECVDAGGYLDPQAQCRCVCNGTFCFGPTGTRSMTATLTLMDTVTPEKGGTPSPTALPTATSSPTASSPPSPTASPSATTRTPGTASPSGGQQTGSPTGPSHSTNPSSTTTNTVSPGGSPTATNQPLPSSSLSPSPPAGPTPTPSGNSGSSSPSPQGSASESPQTIQPTRDTTSPTATAATASPTSDPSGDGTTSPTPQATGTGLPSDTPSGWTATPTTTDVVTPTWGSGSPAPTETSTAAPSGSPVWTSSSSPAGTPTTDLPSSESNAPTPSPTPVATGSVAPTPAKPTNHSWSITVTQTNDMTITVTPPLLSETMTLTSSIELYPTSPFVPAMIPVLPPTLTTSRDFSAAFVGSSDAQFLLGGVSVILEDYYDHPGLIPISKLLQEVQSPLVADNVFVTPGAILFHVNPLAYRKEIIAPVLVPVAQFEDSRCAPRYDLPSDIWNATWNATENGTSWLGVPASDVRYIFDLFIYGPVFRTCYNSFSLVSGAPVYWLDRETLINYVVVTPAQLAAVPAASSFTDVRLASDLKLLETIQTIHPILWCILGAFLLISSPQLILDVQLSAMLAAVAMRSPNACVNGIPTNLFSYLLRPYPLMAMVLPFSWSGEVETTSEHLSNFWAHAAGLLFLIVAFAMLKVLSALRGWSDDDDASPEAHSVMRKVLRPGGWVYFSQFFCGLLITGTVFSAVSALRAVGVGASTSDPPVIASLVLMPLTVLGFIALCIVLGHFALSAARSLDPAAPTYHNIESLLRVREDKRSSKSLHTELRRAVPKTLMWSRTLAVCVSVWFPPWWLLPRGYWVFPAASQKFKCSPRAQSYLHRQRREDTKRDAFTRWSPLLHVVRNVVLAVLLGMTGPELPCWQDSASTLQPPEQSPHIGFDVGIGLAAAVVGVWVLFVVVVKPFRSVTFTILGVWLCLVFVVVSTVMTVHGTFPRGGVYSLQTVGTSTDPDDTPEGLTSLLLATDAIALILVLLLLLERHVLDGYIEEVDRAAASQLRHRDALEATFLEAPVAVVAGNGAALNSEEDPLEMSAIALGYSPPRVPPPAAFSPLDALRKMVEADATSHAAGKHKKRRGHGKGARGGRSREVRRENSGGSSDDDVWSRSSGDSSDSSVSLSGTANVRAAGSAVPPAASGGGGGGASVPFNPLDSSPPLQGKKRAGGGKGVTSQASKALPTPQRRSKPPTTTGIDFDALEAMLFRNDPLPAGDVSAQLPLSAPPMDHAAAANLWKR